MHIESQNVEKKLLVRLEKLATNASLGMRCIHVDLTEAERVLALKTPTLIETLQQTISADDLCIYFCEDGETFLLASAIPRKEALEAQVKLAALLGDTTLADRYNIYDLTQNCGSILQHLAEKLKARREAEKREAARLLELKKQRLREAILKAPIDASLKASLTFRRENRVEPEILLVEDDRFSCRLVRGAMDKKYPLHIAYDGREAIDQYFLRAPDIVFLDIDLPDITGQELLEHFKTHDPNAFVVMLSANSDRDNVLSAVNKGAKGFICKPFTRDKLDEYIKKFKAQK